jgi:hypothetical protein
VGVSLEDIGIRFWNIIFDQFQNHLQSCFKDSQDAPPGFFQYAEQSCFKDSQDAPPGSFQYADQSCFNDSQDAPPGSFQYLIQSCLIKSLVPEDAHPLKPKTIIKAINASFFIFPSLLTCISHFF